ncbi:unnamed protein product, partial [Rotaria sp. Silwood2]
TILLKFLQVIASTSSQKISSPHPSLITKTITIPNPTQLNSSPTQIHSPIKSNDAISSYTNDLDLRKDPLFRVADNDDELNTLNISNVQEKENLHLPIHVKNWSILQVEEYIEKLTNINIAEVFVSMKLMVEHYYY